VPLKRLHKQFPCAAEFALGVLDGKWKTSILSALRDGPCRYGELRALLPQVSDKMLSQRLHELLDLGLVVRQGRGPSSRAKGYALSALGHSLESTVTALRLWGTQHATAFGGSTFGAGVPQSGPMLSRRQRPGLDSAPDERS
jgi:DNA-binding HxlR family transcriptional regulator